MASKTFVDQIPPAGGRIYQLEQQGVSNQYKITDVTQYEQEGTPWTAADANHVYEMAEGSAFESVVITPGSGYGSNLSRVSASDVYVDVYISLVKNSNPVYYDTICTLPENARPQFQFTCPAVFRNTANGTTQFAVAELNTNGEVKINCPAPDPSLGLTQIIIKTGFALQ